MPDGCRVKSRTYGRVSDRTHLLGMYGCKRDLHRSQVYPPKALPSFFTQWRGCAEGAYNSIWSILRGKMTNIRKQASSNLLFLAPFALVLLAGCLQLEIVGTTNKQTSSPASDLWQGTKQFGVSGSSINTLGYGDAVDSAGDVLISGYTVGNLVAGSGSATGTEDAFVRQYDSSGVLQWTSQIGVSALQTDGYGGDAVDTSNDVFVTGYTSGNLTTISSHTSMAGGNLYAGLGASTGTDDAFVTMFSSAGLLQWTTQLGIAGQVTHSSAVIPYGSSAIDVVGYTNGGLTTLGGSTVNSNGILYAGSGSSIGSPDAFVATLNSSGVLQWADQLGVSGQGTEGKGAAVDSSGNIYITGYTTGDLSAPSSAAGANGTAYSGSGASTGTDDAFVAKFSPSGVLDWATNLGVAGEATIAKGIGVDSSGNVYISGDTGGVLPGSGAVANGSRQSFVAQFDSSGTLQWVQQLAATGTGSGDAVAYGLALDSSSGRVTIVGSTYGSLDSDTWMAGAGFTDFFIAQYSTSGALEWVAQLGVSGFSSVAESVALDSSGDAFVAGYTTGGLDGNTLSGTGNYDGFVTKYNSSGVKQ